MMTPKNPWTLSRLEEYIGQEETYQIEFKSSKGLIQQTTGDLDKTFNDLSTHVSAFLNSEGGLLIIGIEESDKRDKKQAGKAISLSQGVPRSLLTPHQIQNKLCDRIQPSVASYVIVNTVRVGVQDNEELLAFVVEVRQGITAYQAADKKYYFRRSFSSEPMDDRDVRLRMLADNIPRIQLSIENSATPLNYSWSAYERECLSYQEAKQRLAAMPTPQVLTFEETQELILSGKLEINPDAVKFRPRRVEKCRIKSSILVKNMGMVSIKRACVQYKLPRSNLSTIEIDVGSKDLDILTENKYSYRELNFDKTGEVLLYPDMSNSIFQFYIDVPIEFISIPFHEFGEVIVYLDGGPSERFSLNINLIIEKSLREFNDNLRDIQSKYSYLTAD